MAASYPSATKSFTTKTDGPTSTIFAAHVNEIQDEIVALENALRTGLQHNLIFTDATYDIGASGATRPRDLYLSRNAVIGAALTVAGVAITPAEGTWTPTIGGSTSQSGQAYSLQSAYYTKVGKQVHAQGRVTLSTLGTITGEVCIKGLPFTPDTTYYGAGEIGLFAALTTSVIGLRCFVSPVTGFLHLRMQTVASVATVAMAQADLSATTDLIFSISYRATT